MYVHGGRIGHVTWTIWTNFHSPIRWRFHMKPSVIFGTDLIELEHSMMHTKFQGHEPLGSREEDCFNVFTTYGHGGHLGHVTKTIWAKYRSPIPKKLHMKFDFDWLSGFWGEHV